MKKYIAKSDTWFDEGTEAKLLGELINEVGLFRGIHNGEEDEELCPLEEFNVIETDIKW